MVHICHGSEDPRQIYTITPNVITTASADDKNDVKDEVKTACFLWHNNTHQRKFVYTVFIFSSYFALGFSISQNGATFLDLQIITNTDLEKGSAFFTSWSVGYLLGSFIIGIIYEKLNKILIHFSTTLGMGILAFVIPFCSIYGLMVAVQLASGIFMGGIDTSANAELIRLWGAKGRSIMQTAHFSFAFGGVIGPLVTKPFLAPLLSRSNNNSSTLDRTVLDIQDNGTVTQSLNGLSNTTVLSTEQREIMVFYAYVITASLAVISATLILMVYFWERSHMKKRAPSEEGQQHNQDQNRLSVPVFAVTMSLICLMYMLYSCVEDSYFAFLMTFVVKNEKWSKAKGTDLTSAFWASLATGRFLGIFFTKCISPVMLVFLCCSGLILALIGFLVSAMYHTEEGIWAFSAGTGLAMALFFPTAILWTEEKLIKITGKVSSAILISVSIGAIINPSLLGYLMSRRDPIWFVYVLIVESVACMCVFLVLWIFSNTILKDTRINKDISVTVTVNSTKL